VFSFCRLFLGNRTDAEAICAEAFAEFCRKYSELPIAGAIPWQLIHYAYTALQPLPGASSTAPSAPALEDCILSLNYQQRAVFIMRNVLGMSWDAISKAAEQPIDDVRQNGSEEC
jgi:DNA-directed RNA polymerase specialized sigma24 family protein